MSKFFKYSLVLFLLSMMFISCSTYNKVLNKGTSKERYKMANELYKEQSYSKAIRMYELALPSYGGKPQAEVIIFRLADANYNTKDYATAIYYYEKFINSYPKSTEIETGQFRVAKSFYKLSPKYSVDQKDTRKALESFQNFIDQNPNSTRLPEANNLVTNLNLKLEKKAIEIAKQYFKIGNYKSAIAAFDNVILDHLGTQYKEEAMYYKFRAAFELSMNSVSHKKEIRIKEAIKSYTRYKKTFPSSENFKKAEGLYNKLIKERTTIKQLNS